MKTYIAPTISITTINSEDIITTSSLAVKNVNRSSIGTDDFATINLNS